MITLDESQISEAPAEEVWKILYDSSRFPEWWACLERVGAGPDGQVVEWPADHPRLPFPEVVGQSSADGRITLSCAIADLRFDWRLEPLDGDGATQIMLHATLPEREADRLDVHRVLLRRSIERLAEAAARAVA